MRKLGGFNNRQKQIEYIDKLLEGYESPVLYAVDTEGNKLEETFGSVYTPTYIGTDKLPISKLRTAKTSMQGVVDSTQSKIVPPAVVIDISKPPSAEKVNIPKHDQGVMPVTEEGKPKKKIKRRKNSLPGYKILFHPPL